MVFYGYYSMDGNAIFGILLILWGISTIWVNVEDRGDHLLIRYGPCRWMLCGMGKEKIPYRSIKDYEVTQTCFYGWGIGPGGICNGSSVKLFNTCSCCYGYNGKCCKHKTIRLTIKERPQAQNALDENGNDCCCEKCFFKACCGENGRYIGKGCCFQPCCNPCNANCCMVNTVFISTNDEDGLIALLNENCQHIQFADI